MIDYEQRARAAGGRVVRAQKAGMGISQWGKWLAEIRQHIESAKQQATCDAKRQVVRRNPSLTSILSADGV
ncbi:hypothetical protein G7Y41_06855 [Schaalia sp. ZJ405]|uniref:hypothetical protein n=1 Tax=Schaalia sp. ZJ405 TaxID=2709403 RepID=UPI0013EACE62|nr:hypothetical protein [Schaalia sp. ZJ405]QPK80775.1 hypothetical protein G7Y41_06855 [Schaalia sp. ZJ405]